jgi:DNA replicative helicase MCM subunit Mcm2 (Cdc46/Mcm family)
MFIQFRDLNRGRIESIKDRYGVTGMEDRMNEQLVSEFAKDILGELAPQEKALFKPISEAYFKNPEKVLAAQQGKDELLGFGAAEAAALITPIVLAVSTEVVQFLFQEARKAVQSESSSLINETVKSWFGKLQPEEKEKTSPPPPPLTPEQLEQVRKIAIKKARLLKLSETNTKLLADAIVGGLAT